jgi:hypothetical protein
MNGPKVLYLNESRSDESSFDYLAYTADFALFARFNGTRTNATIACDFNLTAYPTSVFRNSYNTNEPAMFAIVVVAVFAFTAISFLCYDAAVHRRNEKVVRTAARTSAIVASIFPKEVQKRMLEEAEEKERNDDLYKRRNKQSMSAELKDFLSLNKDNLGEGKALTSVSVHRTKPIADFFPSVTLMFADLVGFTAWSSTREPTQVFVLLETIYHEFDVIASRRGVYKVETVGDCYVAVCGLPTPRKDHALVMCRFAHDCLNKVASVLQCLEVELGPDTADLGMRFGIHSGPVTAGVLRGER